MKKLRKDNYVRFRINGEDKDRIDQLVISTGIKKSELFRQAMQRFIQEVHPGPLFKN